MTHRPLRNSARNRLHECTVATFHLSMLSEETRMQSNGDHLVTGYRLATDDIQTSKRQCQNMKTIIIISLS